MSSASWFVLAAVLCGAALAQPPPQRPVCPRNYTKSCSALQRSYTNYYFTVNGIFIAYEFENGIFTLRCSSIALDEPALPRYEPALPVREVQLYDCWPRTTSYATALHALNLIGLDKPRPGNANILPTYNIQINLYQIKNFKMNLLTTIPTLRYLRFSKMTVKATDLTLLPAGLNQLELLFTKIHRIPATALDRLPHLGELMVSDMESLLLETVGKQKHLELCSSATTLVNESLPDTLEKLEICSWTAQRPKPWRLCGGLRTLHIIGATAMTLELPDRWLVHCVHLRSLRMIDTTNLRLPEGGLRGVTALEEVRFVRCALKTLPARLLDDAQALRLLDLEANNLLTLPSTLFRHWQFLRELRFDNNPALDDCPLRRVVDYNLTQGWSPLRNLTNLRELSLVGTATSRVCAGWRQLPRLQRFELNDTSITHLNYTDLQFNTRDNITVILPKVDLILTRKDYASIRTAPAGPTVTLILNQPLRCDCELYWAAAALRLNHSRLREERTRCNNRRELHTMLLDELVCSPLSPCPDNCTCTAREDMARSGHVLQLDCAQAQLRHVPRVNPQAILPYAVTEPVELDMHLANNRINQLSPGDVPPGLTVLDLRNNMLSAIDATCAAALVSRVNRSVLLAGNPFDCSCQAAGATLVAMRAYTDVFIDWTDIICYDGNSTLSLGALFCEDRTIQPENKKKIVADNTTEGILHYTTPYTFENKSMDGSKVKTMSWTPVLSVAAAMAAVVVIVLGFELRRRAINFKRAQAPSPLWLERRRPEPDEWEYDAFVSFAHADEAVVSELVTQLEGGATPLRLCVHYRDWVPGGWIPDQIAASVRVSRRTVAVVSEAFLRSRWARAEFREAYAAALEDTEPRLVLVLLEDPARLQLEPELRAYISGNTYVRWGDPWFWKKLRHALPTTSPHPVGEAGIVGPGAAHQSPETMTTTHV